MGWPLWTPGSWHHRHVQYCIFIFFYIIIILVLSCFITFLDTNSLIYSIYWINWEDSCVLIFSSSLRHQLIHYCIFYIFLLNNYISTVLFIVLFIDTNSLIYFIYWITWEDSCVVKLSLLAPPLTCSFLHLYNLSI